MFGWNEILLLLGVLALLALALMRSFRPYRSLLGVGCAFLLITALFPRPGNPIGTFLFGGVPGGWHPPLELFGIAWWALGAWLLKRLMDLVLRRTVFPNNDEPHARRLFADLAAALIYALAFVGMLDTVFRMQVSALLATSGVFAIVIGFALQSTLGDVLSGLAINIERPFGAGDWISIGDQVTGQVQEINWRATRIRTVASDTVAVPNSVVSKAVVTNHSHPPGRHDCVILLRVDVSVSPLRVIEALLDVARDAEGAVSVPPQAFAQAFSDNFVTYELAFVIESFAETRRARSAMVTRVAERFRLLGIPIGTLPMQVQIVRGGGRGGAGPPGAIANAARASDHPAQ
jgi:hypothetical protein